MPQTGQRAAPYLTRGIYMENKEQNIREQIIEQYTKDVEKLVRYLPWLHKVKGSDVESAYEGEGKEIYLLSDVHCNVHPFCFMLF